MNDADQAAEAAGPATRPVTPRRQLHPVLIGTGSLIVLLAASALVVAAVTSGTGLATLDRPIQDAMLALRTPAANTAFTAFTNLGQTLPMVIIGLALTGALYLRYRKGLIWVLMLVTPLGSTNLTSLGKAFFARARPPFSDAVPPHETSFAFPSGHTLNSTAIAGMLAYLTLWLARRAWVRIAAIIAALTWSLAMGFSRIYLGHHWLSDVVFGWLLGLSWLTILILAHQLLLLARAAAAAPQPPAKDPA